jgi:pyrroloquinoline-quinone synthase
MSYSYPDNATFPAEVLSRDEFEAAIRAVGAERYHDKHPFHKMLHGGELSKEQVQAWALNRYCYQSAVPRKDAALMSRVHNNELRREWMHRIVDHDGLDKEAGGIERWLAGMLENYDFIDDSVMAYFKRRLTQAPRDADFALEYIKQNARNRIEQEACIEAVRFKCNVLWAQLDALHHAYVNGHIPPGAFRPGETNV